MRRLSAAASLLLTLLAVMPPPARALVSDHSADGLTLTLPDDWVEVPKEKLAEMAKNLRDSMPGTKVPNYSFAYQKKAEQWFAYPYILVVIDNSGRPGERNLSEMKNTDMDAVIKTTGSATKDYLTDLNLSKPVYDQATNRIWLTGGASYGEAGYISSLTTGIPTETGIIWLYGYAKKADFDAARPVLTKIAESAVVPERLKYQWRNSAVFLGHFDLTHVGSSALTGALIGGASGLVIWLMRRGKTAK